MYNYPYYMPRNEQVVKVNGEQSARMLNLAPNSSMLALDENAPIVYLIQTDGAGYKTISAFEITPKKQPNFNDFSTLEERINKLEERLNEQPNFEQNKPTACDEYDVLDKKHKQ